MELLVFYEIEDLKTCFCFHFVIDELFDIEIKILLGINMQK